VKETVKINKYFLLRKSFIQYLNYILKRVETIILLDLNRIYIRLKVFNLVLKIIRRFNKEIFEIFLFFNIKKNFLFKSLVLLKTTQVFGNFKIKTFIQSLLFNVNRSIIN
jgi:hypothetical protein